MIPNEHLQKLREAALRKRRGLNLARPTSISDAAARLIEDTTAMFVAGDTRLSAQVDVDIHNVKGLDFDPLVLLASNPNTSMAYALVEKKLHDAILPLLIADIDITQIQLREFRTKILYDNVTCRFIVDLDVIEVEDHPHPYSISEGH